MKPRLVWRNDRQKWFTKTVTDWLALWEMKKAKFEGRKFDPDNKAK